MHVIFIHLHIKAVNNMVELKDNLKSVRILMYNLN